MKALIFSICSTFFALLFLSSCNNANSVNSAQERTVRDSLEAILSTKFNNGITVIKLNKITQDNATGSTFQIMFAATVLAKRKLFLNPSATVFAYSGFEAGSKFNTFGYDSLSKGDTLSLIGSAFLQKNGNSWSVSGIDYAKDRH